MPRKEEGNAGLLHQDRDNISTRKMKENNNNSDNNENREGRRNNFRGLRTHADTNLCGEDFVISMPHGDVGSVEHN